MPFDDEVLEDVILPIVSWESKSDLKVDCLKKDSLASDSQWETWSRGRSSRVYMCLAQRPFMVIVFSDPGELPVCAMMVERGKACELVTDPVPFPICNFM